MLGDSTNREAARIHPQRSVTDPFLLDLWRRSCGAPEARVAEQMPGLDVLQKTEWSPRFEQLMRTRLIMGAFRYGRMGAAGKPQFDRIGSAQRRLGQYIKTGNLELLVDAANMCLVEFEEGRHPKRHFRSTDDGEHARSAKP